MAKEELYKIVEISGRKYVEVPLRDKEKSTDGQEVLKTYRVRHYEQPRPEKLDSYAHLMVDFEKRFFRNVDRGHEILGVANIDEYIKQKRAAYKKAQEPEKELEGCMLHTALIRRAVDNALRHIRLRIGESTSEETADPLKRKELEVLYTSINSDFLETLNLPKLRLNRGQPDTDEVVREMVGEPFRVFTASISHSPEAIGEFYRTRYLKTAQAMECIDTVVNTMAQLDVEKTGYRHQHTQETLEKFAHAARERMQLQRSDPDFHAADVALRSIRNEIQDALYNAGKEAPPHLPRDRKNRETGNPLAGALVKNAVNLIYDVAMTRDAQNHRAQELADSVESYVHQAKLRSYTRRA